MELPEIEEDKKVGSLYSKTDLQKAMAEFFNDILPRMDFVEDHFWTNIRIILCMICCSIGCYAQFGLKLHRDCYKSNSSYTPLDMSGQPRTDESSAADCQHRCRSVTGCAHFSWWPDRGCHIQDSGASLVTDPSITAGPPTCVQDRPYILMCVAGYFAFSGLVSLIDYFVIKTSVICIKIGDESVFVDVTLEQFSSEVELGLRSTKRNVKTKVSVSKYFDADRYLAAEPLHADFVQLVKKFQQAQGEKSESKKNK